MHLTCFFSTPHIHCSHTALDCSSHSCNHFGCKHRNCHSCNLAGCNPATGYLYRNHCNFRKSNFDCSSSHNCHSFGFVSRSRGRRNFSSGSSRSCFNRNINQNSSSSINTARSPTPDNADFTCHSSVMGTPSCNWSRNFIVKPNWPQDIHNSAQAAKVTHHLHQN